MQGWDSMIINPWNVHRNSPFWTSLISYSTSRENWTLIRTLCCCASLILSSEPRLCIPFILFPQEAELRSALEEMGLAWFLSSVNLYFWSFCSTGRWTPAHAGRDGFSLNCLLFSFWRLILTSSLLQTKMMHFFLQKLSVFYQRLMSVEWHKTSLFHAVLVNSVCQWLTKCLA